MTTNVGSDTERLGDKARREGDELAGAKPLGWLARIGLVGRGVIYGIIGILALKLALGDGGEATDQQGALKEIAQQSFGELLLILVAVALGGYALWRLVRAAVGHGAEQVDDTKDRLAALGSGIAYAILCFTAIQILSGSGSSSGNTKQTTGGVLDWTGGPIIVGIAGAILIGVAIYQAYKGLSRKFLEDAHTEKMGPTIRTGYTWLGMVGLTARAVIFALIGYGLLKAAIDYDPDEAVGLDGALLTLTQAEFGPLLLGLVAAGLVLFALYSIADARYRKV